MGSLYSNPCANFSLLKMFMLYRSQIALTEKNSWGETIVNNNKLKDLPTSDKFCCLVVNIGANDNGVFSKWLIIPC